MSLPPTSNFKLTSIRTSENLYHSACCGADQKPPLVPVHVPACVVVCLRLRLRVHAAVAAFSAHIYRDKTENGCPWMRGVFVCCLPESTSPNVHPCFPALAIPNQAVGPLNRDDTSIPVLCGPNPRLVVHDTLACRNQEADARVRAPPPIGTARRGRAKTPPLVGGR